MPTSHQTSPPAHELVLRWVQYTDGAWEEPDPDAGPNSAGYGAAELTIANAQEHAAHTARIDICSEPSTFIPLSQVNTQSMNTPEPLLGRVTWAISGTVEVDPDSDEWLGAEAHTNNTGELSALYYALRRALHRPRGQGLEDIYSDSTYSINMTTGTWLPKVRRTKPMIELMRRTWRQLQRRRPGEVRLRHVRSHTQFPGNELADWLADRGAAGERSSSAQAHRWLAGWVERARQRVQDEARGGTLGDPTGVG
jgi:ribonuclease HI